jgi:hypothetical protein
VKVQQGGFDGADDVHGGAEVEGLGSSAAGVTGGELCRNFTQQRAVGGHRLTGDAYAGLLDSCAELLTARNFAEPGAGRRNP